MQQQQFHDGDDDGCLFLNGTRSSLSRHERQSKNHMNNFAHAKDQCLGKRDKSSAGRLDPQVVEICGLLNNNFDEFYTTSSCAGRCFLYTGPGRKATKNNTQFLLFRRYRVSHHRISDPNRYFDLTTLDTDPTGGGDPIILREPPEDGDNEEDDLTDRRTPAIEKAEDNPTAAAASNDGDDTITQPSDQIIWLRYEPFILHVACRSLSAANALLAAARTTFKNVGITTTTTNNNNNRRFLVAIWGDEGLDMPLMTPTITNNNNTHNKNHLVDLYTSAWLAELVNERHERNAAKIERFVQAVRSMPSSIASDEEEKILDLHTMEGDDKSLRIPRSYDVIGDIAVLHSLPTTSTNDTTTSADQLDRIGQAILKKNKAIKLVVLRQSSLGGTERAPTSPFQVLATAKQHQQRNKGKNNNSNNNGEMMVRRPLMTTHREYGISCVVNLDQTFFSPRMGPERLRICQQTARNEHVLILFAGVGMEALQLAARTEAQSVTAIEWNPAAIHCARQSHKMLQRNTKGVQCPGAAERLQILHGDCLELLPTLPRNHYHRILAPRPKEGSLDGNQPEDSSTRNNDDDNDASVDDVSKMSAGGAVFLDALLPVLKRDGGECHWYDFAADHEAPECDRTRRLIHHTCQKHGLDMEVLHVSHVGSVAMRQLRVCVDFRVSTSMDLGATKTTSVQQ